MPWRRCTPERAVAGGRAAGGSHAGRGPPRAHAGPYLHPDRALRRRHPDQRARSEADETYIRSQNPALGAYVAGYYPHKYDFLAFAAAMIRREEQAISAAEKMAALAIPEMLRAPGMTFTQHHLTRHLQMKVRFARWPGHPARRAARGGFTARAGDVELRAGPRAGRAERDCAGRADLAHVRAAPSARRSPRNASSSALPDRSSPSPPRFSRATLRRRKASMLQR